MDIVFTAFTAFASFTVFAAFAGLAGCAGAAALPETAFALRGAREGKALMVDESFPIDSSNGGTRTQGYTSHTRNEENHP
ncbi:hypothetical protein [Corynebacterium vitaeruminis]|uniref:hypothetical protein n=1 Tax=Corynebacterium vitaeruminis TaxID=38305 RepID=UPI0023F42D5F|nr:hypothetical protein [Corynebacterium vitaeruminis]